MAEDEKRHAIGRKVLLNIDMKIDFLDLSGNLVVPDIPDAADLPMPFPPHCLLESTGDFKLPDTFQSGPGEVENGVYKADFELSDQDLQRMRTVFRNGKLDPG